MMVLTDGSTHRSLAGVFSTLTRMPGKHRIGGEQAMLFVGSIRERLDSRHRRIRKMRPGIKLHASRPLVTGGTCKIE